MNLKEEAQVAAHRQETNACRPTAPKGLPGPTGRIGEIENQQSAESAKCDGLCEKTSSIRSGP